MSSAVQHDHDPTLPCSQHQHIVIAFDHIRISIFETGSYGGEKPKHDYRKAKKASRWRIVTLLLPSSRLANLTFFWS